MNKRKIKTLISAILIIAVSISISFNTVYAVEIATPGLKISMNEALEAALGSMEDIKISVVETEKAYHKYRETQTLWYPNLTGHGEWTNNARYPVNQRYPQGWLSDYETGAGATLRQVIWSFGRISSAVEAARKSVEIGKLNEEGKQADVIYNTKLAYYTVIFAQKALGIVLQSYQNSLDNKKILENRSAMGRVSRKDNIKIEADIAARIPFVTNVQADIIASQNTLKRIMGLDFDVDIELTDGFRKSYEEKSYTDLVKYLWTREPTLKMLEENISLQDSLIKVEKAEYLPNISAFASWDYRGRSDEAKDWYIGQEKLMDQFGVIGLKVDILIFDCGAIREKIKQAQKGKEKAILELQKTSRDLTLELDNAVSEYNEYVKTLAANIKSVELSKKSFKLFQGLFETGQVTLLELNDAELSLTNQKVAKETTFYNLNITLARIERLIAEGVGE
jgi:outer membrane protein